MFRNFAGSVVILGRNIFFPVRKTFKIVIEFKVMEVFLSVDKDKKDHNQDYYFLPIITNKNISRCKTQKYSSFFKTQDHYNSN